MFRLYEGTLVQAALTNRLDGSFTGPVNCVVSAPVLATGGKTAALILPKARAFIGKANKVEAENQTRLAVTFKRLILPNGYSVDLEAAPGLDDAGETGLKGKVDNHNYGGNSESRVLSGSWAGSHCSTPDKRIPIPPGWPTPRAVRQRVF